MCPSVFVAEGPMCVCCVSVCVCVVVCLSVSVWLWGPSVLCGCGVGSLSLSVCLCGRCVVFVCLCGRGACVAWHAEPRPCPEPGCGQVLATYTLLRTHMAEHNKK